MSGDPIRDAIQQVIDGDGSGWIVAHYVVSVGLDRVNEDSMQIGATWLHAPDTQAGYITDGLLDAALEHRADEKDHGGEP